MKHEPLGRRSSIPPFTVLYFLQKYMTINRIDNRLRKAFNRLCKQCDAAEAFARSKNNLRSMFLRLTSFLVLPINFAQSNTHIHFLFVPQMTSFAW